MLNELMKLEIQQTMKDKGIPLDVIRDAVEAAITSAYKKDHGRDLNIQFKINPLNGEIKAYTTLLVVDEVLAPEREISYEDALKLDPIEAANCFISLNEKNEKVEAKYSPEALQDFWQQALENTSKEVILLVPRESIELKFSRIATQSAKQVVMQRIKDAERELVFNEYLSKVGQMVSGKIRRIEGGTIFVELDKTEGQLPQSEQVYKDVYKPKNTIRAIIVKVEKENRGPKITLSRAHPDFVRQLFALEVPEIADGNVQIVNIAREPGSRTKIAVYSTSPDIDPVGACVGSKGARVQAVVNELKGENIDVIHWTNDNFDYIANALSPAQVYSVEVFEEEQSAEVIVPDDQVSLAIGKAGQNVRLAAKLTGWHIDIKKQSDKVAEEEKEHVLAMEEELKVVLATDIADLPIRRTAQNALIEAGYSILNDLIEESKDKILSIKGFGANSLEDLNRFLREYGIEIE